MYYVVLKVEDYCVLEFAALALSELAKEPSGCGQLVSANILGVLFDRMKKCPDPDVQYNCLLVSIAIPKILLKSLFHHQHQSIHTSHCWARVSSQGSISLEVIRYK